MSEEKEQEAQEKEIGIKSLKNINIPKNILIFEEKWTSIFYVESSPNFRPLFFRDELFNDMTEMLEPFNKFNESNLLDDDESCNKLNEFLCSLDPWISKDEIEKFVMYDGIKRDYTALLKAAAIQMTANKLSKFSDQFLIDFGGDIAISTKKQIVANSSDIDGGNIALPPGKYSIHSSGLNEKRGEHIIKKDPENNKTKLATCVIEGIHAIKANYISTNLVADANFEVKQDGINTRRWN